MKRKYKITKEVIIVSKSLSSSTCTKCKSSIVKREDTQSHVLCELCEKKHQLRWERGTQRCFTKLPLDIAIEGQEEAYAEEIELYKIYGGD